MVKPKKGDSCRGRPRSFRFNADLDGDLEKLRKAFGYSSLNEMAEDSLELFRTIHTYLSKITKPLHEWDDEDWNLAMFPEEVPQSQGLQRADLIVRWLKTRYGTMFEDMWKERIG